MSTGRLEEIKLLALCMASDNRRAFSRLVEIHQHGLRRFILNLTAGDEALTDDLSQETFLKAWLAIRSFHGLSGFKTWLYRIAINEYSSYRRSVAARFGVGAVDAAELNVPEGVSSVGIAEAKMDVATIVSRLPENERIVVLLFYLEEQPIKEIVKITGMPEGTVKSHLSRARSRLKALI